MWEGKREKKGLIQNATRIRPFKLKMTPKIPGDRGSINTMIDELCYVIQVDCTNKALNGKACRQEKIRGYPTVLPYRNGKRLREIFLLKAGA